MCRKGGVTSTVVKLCCYVMYMCSVRMRKLLLRVSALFSEFVLIASAQNPQHHLHTRYDGPSSTDRGAYCVAWQETLKGRWG